MTKQRICSWCHELNNDTAQSCRNCGHDSHVPRMLCRCSSCRAELERYARRVARARK